MKIVIGILLLLLISCFQDEDKVGNKANKSLFMGLNPLTSNEELIECSQFLSSEISKCHWYSYKLGYDTIQVSVLDFANEETALEYYQGLNRYPEFLGLAQGQRVIILDGKGQRFISEDMKRSALSVFSLPLSDTFLINALPSDESKNIVAFSSFRIVQGENYEVLKSLVLKSGLEIAYSKEFQSVDFEKFRFEKLIFHQDVGSIFKLESKELVLPIQFRDQLLLLITPKNPKILVELAKKFNFEVNTP